MNVYIVEKYGLFHELKDDGSILRVEVKLKRAFDLSVNDLMELLRLKAVDMCSKTTCNC